MGDVELKKLCTDILTMAKVANGSNLLTYIPQHVQYVDFSLFLDCMYNTAGELGFVKQQLLIKECMSKYSKSGQWWYILDNMLLRLKYCDWD